jgi:CRP-like cAMP-binding protein
MTDIHALFDCLNAIAPISKGFNDYLIGVMETAEYKKGSFLLREGTVCHQVWWLRKGLVRFFYRFNAREVSHSFIAENNMILALRSLYDQDRSKQAIQAIEDCVTWYIDYPAIEYIYKNFPEAQAIGRRTAEQYYTMLEQRLEAIALQKSVDRYRYLESHFPDLLQRVSLKHLASFLNMEVHTISRIRSRK